MKIYAGNTRSLFTNILSDFQVELAQLEVTFKNILSIYLSINESS